MRQTNKKKDALWEGGEEMDRRVRHSIIVSQQTDAAVLFNLLVACCLSFELVSVFTSFRSVVSLTHAPLHFFGGIREVTFESSWGHFRMPRSPFVTQIVGGCGNCKIGGRLCEGQRSSR